MPEDDETARLDPPPSEPLKLSSGLLIRTVPMRTRQVFRLMRVLTHGAGGALVAGALDFNAKPEEFIGKLAAIAMMAIPDAEDETIQFLASMCEPAAITKPVPGGELSEKQREANDALFKEMNRELFNPDPIDTVDIIERIIRTEGADLQALGKRLSRMAQVFLKTGQDKEKVEEVPLPGPQELSEQAPPEPSLSAPSPPSSTPSAPSTDGPTSTSLISPSADSVPLAPPSVPVGVPESTPSGS